MKKILHYIVLGTMIGATSIYAASTDNDTIIINAEVPEISSISVTDGAVTLSDLGNSSYANEILGSITLHTNDPDGFTISLSSDQSGQLVRHDGSYTYEVADTTNAINYDITLDLASGSLPSGYSVGTLTNIDPDGGSVAFTGSSLDPVDGIQYNIEFNSARKAIVQGDYADTLTITITNNT